MTQPPQAPPDADRAVRELAQRWMPTSFRAFHQRYYRIYKRYAELQLGDLQAADVLVQRVMTGLALHWARMGNDPAPRATAWAILRIAIAEELRCQGREPALTETAAFRRATLDTLRPAFAALETSIGLYSAIARLPERPYDVIVLQYVLEHPPEEVAAIMGIAPATVRSHRMTARIKLARDLGIALDPDPDPDDDDKEE